MGYELGFFTEDNAVRLLELLEKWDSGILPTPGEKDYEGDASPVQEWLFVKLTQNLDPATSHFTGQKQATAQIVKDTVDDNLNRKNTSGTTGEITVTNRSPDFQARWGDFFWVCRTEAEYAPVGAPVTELEAVLLTSLNAATEALGTPSTATAGILVPTTMGGVQLILSCVEVTVTNRYEAISLEAGTYIQIKRLNGRWHLSGADCTNTSISTVCSSVE